MAALMPGNVNALWQLARWRLRRETAWLFRSLGWSSVALGAIALLTFTVGLVALDRTRSAHVMYAELQRQQAMPAGVRPVAPAEDAEVVANYFAGLPKSEQIPAVLGELLLLAHQHRVSLGAGEYRIQTGIQTGVPTGKTGAQRRSSGYRIRFPISGDAAAIQAFVIDALNAHGSLALDAFSMRRESAASSHVEASVQFVLLVADRGAAVPAT